MNAPYTTADQIQQAAHERNDKLNNVHNVSSYCDHLKRPRTEKYRVLPDGTVEFIRR